MMRLTRRGRWVLGTIGLLLAALLGFATGHIAWDGDRYVNIEEQR